MSYYQGNKLDKKVEAFGLTNLKELLTKVKAGEVTWPGTYKITPAAADQIESLRILLYSILHAAQVKDQFKVKLTADAILVEQKIVPKIVSTEIVGTELLD